MHFIIMYINIYTIFLSYLIISKKSIKIFEMYEKEIIQK